MTTFVVMSISLALIAAAMWLIAWLADTEVRCTCGHGGSLHEGDGYCTQCTCRRFTHPDVPDTHWL